MSAETILIASDHAGYEMKQHLAAHLRAKGFQVEDLGTEGTESVDYPDFGIALAEASARLSRQHNDANVIALGARLIGPETAVQCLDAFLETPFEGGRHQRRVDKLGA